MPKLEFSDGIEIETGGEPRIIHLHDGLYVVGHGMLCPVDTEADGITLIRLIWSFELKPDPGDKL